MICTIAKTPFGVFLSLLKMNNPNPRRAERAGLDFLTAAGGGLREKSQGAAVGRDRGAFDTESRRRREIFHLKSERIYAIMNLGKAVLLKVSELDQLIFK